MTASVYSSQSQAWWKESSVYQIYPASFLDTNGDGVGDLPGIISKVDYLQRLGIDLLWLSPILKSPQVDMGYDISDYKTIDAQYGSLEDVDLLISELKKRDMHLIMDLVVNHTSDQHEWFKQSRESKDNPFRDWYIWKPARYDEQGNRHPPNNWLAEFRGSVWEWDEKTEEYYLHIFAVEQPDLNWENPKVRAAVHDIIRFWLKRGTKGFRMDVINMISKDQRFPDAPIKDSEQEYQPGDLYYKCGPRLHEYLHEIGTILKEYDAFSVGEMPYVSDEKEIIKAVGADRGELAMIFIFDHVELDHNKKGRFLPREIPLTELKTCVKKWQTLMYEQDGWNSLYLENHDQPRSVSRFASDAPEHRVASSKLLATYLGCQAGTPFIYEGQELGMTNVPWEWPIEKYQDLLTLNNWAELKRKSKDSADFKTAMEEYRKKSRDNARTPMQWTSGPNAGFTDAAVTPWMSVNDNYPEINVEMQLKDSDSPFFYWSSMLKVRKQHKNILVYGGFQMIDMDNDKILAYKRTGVEQDILVVCNFSDGGVSWDGFADVAVREVLLSNFDRRNVDLKDVVELRPYEAIAVLLQ